MTGMLKDMIDNYLLDDFVESWQGIYFNKSQNRWRRTFPWNG